jgi:signal transduction histidine kinase
VASAPSGTTTPASSSSAGDEDLPHIFERFYRADKSRTRAEGRTGLGLAIVHAIAQAHGGEIIVHRRIGQGSTFIVRLPSHSSCHTK